MTKVPLSAALAILLATSASAQIRSGDLVGGGGNVTPGTNTFFANPENIVPAGTGNIWFVNGNSGSDSNDCKSPAKGCLTIGHAISLATTLTNDVISVHVNCHNVNAGFNEQVSITKANLTLTAANPATQQGQESDFCLQTLGTALTIQANNVSVYGITIFGGLDDNPPVVIGPNALDVTIAKSWLDGAGGVSPVVQIDDTAGSARLHLVEDTISDGGTGGGIESIAGSTPETVVEKTRFWANGGPDVNGQGDDSTGYGWKIVNNSFEDLDKATYIDLSLGTIALHTVVADNTFAVTGPLTLTHVKLPATVTLANNNPPGPVGSVVTVNKTITNSAVLSASPTNILTASGDVYVTKIVAMTDATGFANCTNYVIKQDRAIGGATVASQAITSLGASVTFDFANAATTALLPFSLASGGHIQDQATAAPCNTAPTAGSTQLSVTYTRLSPYASLQ